MGRLLGFVSSLLVVLSPLFFANDLFANEKGSSQVTIGTGAANGVYYPVGQALCRTVVKQKSWRESQCQVLESQGSIYNLDALRAGKLDFAIVQADWQYFAYSSEHQFVDKTPLSSLRAVFSLHAEPFTVVARKDSGISHFSELRGKKVNIGNLGSGQRATMEVLMKALEWKNSDFAFVAEFGADQQLQALCSGAVDAVVYTIGHPSNAIQDMTLACETNIVEVSGEVVDQLVSKHSFYSKDLIPGGIYRGTPQDVETFAVRATLVTTERVDPKLVYGLTKATFTDLGSFRRMLRALGTINEQSMTGQGIFVPLHLGAEQYFKEVGLL